MSKTEHSKNPMLRQLGRTLCYHLLGIFVIFVIFYGFFISMHMIKILDAILGFVALIVYGLVMAATAKGIADRDLLLQDKKYIFPAKGLVLASAVVLLNILIFLSVKLSWWLGAPNALKLTFQFLFFFLTIPYNYFLNIAGASIKGAGVILMVIIPLLSMGAGYLAGYKKWDIFEKLDKIAFENKKNK